MEQSLVSLERMRTFVRIAERGNLAAVARESGAGQSTITRHLRELEEALGVSLLTRTTRRTALTDEGARYYAHCVQILSLVEQAGQEMRDTRQATAGTVRISCTGALGVLYISRLIYEFQDQNPGIRIEFGLTDERIDLVRDGVDIAIRLGPLSDCAMKLRSLGESQRVLVASPEWLARHGPVRRLEDLRDLEGVRMSRVHGSERLLLQDAEGRDHIVPFHGRLTVDHGLAARDAFLAGRGFGPAHRWLVEDCLRDGRLEQVLPDYTLPAAPLSMLIAPERTNLTRVRLCAEFLAARAREIPGISR
ncbi:MULTISPECIES: LysR family transcriptional regulator [Acetobacter]|jgi:DNA-binding transcriptional LysR family regulator|uniref:DNA-binding transcriptional LysR family regulator n=1 Tax=Acetobacter lovaniensis TaxID=104100 RepID=A0A841QH41_9PROT|nr:LysR family transcriptional regulator [Acetobacter lovaniensis]MBB6457738.1 DNA-binding transcriptional LysR family regulator [Acetobacter lovaniensis]MCI1698615.1 LysR family transcriptional regulator [Acetobacter lovaniensis]MCP1239921.1 LysR family transcriptional regulator [Acetobacter lovaniensis]NHN82021.1 LysR family transcriptional regulator [Acetobacter lovaniensis]GBQ71889.1 LysR family transcriptional regulator [Acetobacter lovaniensis NRIC 0474]